MSEPKKATSLFDFVAGEAVIPPSDEEIKAIDAPQKQRELLNAWKESADTLCERLKFLSAEGKLEAARHIAKGVNASSKLFNVAVFQQGKPVDLTGDLFEAEPETNLL